MRRIFSVTPIHVAPGELERRRRRYAELAPRGTRIELLDAGPAAPRELAQRADLHASERAISTALTIAEDYDYVMPDCVLDPALPEHPRPAGMPYPQPAGMLCLTLKELHTAGHRIAAVTRNAVIGEELTRKVAEYGHGATFLGVTILNLELGAVSDSTAWNEAMRSALEELAGRGATAVINGCSAVDVARPGGGPLVVDPAETALRALDDDR